jgi:hypothetical protein
VYIVADETTSIPSRRAFTGLSKSHSGQRVAVFCGPLCRRFTRQWRWTRPAAMAARASLRYARGQAQAGRWRVCARDAGFGGARARTTAGCAHGVGVEGGLGAVRNGRCDRADGAVWYMQARTRPRGVSRVAKQGVMKSRGESGASTMTARLAATLVDAGRCLRPAVCSARSPAVNPSTSTRSVGAASLLRAASGLLGQDGK